MALKDLIPIELPKGCTLFLTLEEYARGIKRGKAIRRVKQFRKQVAQKIVKEEHLDGSSK